MYYVRLDLGSDGFFCMGGVERLRVNIRIRVYRKGVHCEMESKTEGKVLHRRTETHLRHRLESENYRPLLIRGEASWGDTA